MKRIMFYCQYLAGMGHLVRSSEIIRSLVKDFQVCFVNGGQPISNFEFPPEVEVVHLPAILEENGVLKVVDSSQSIEHVKENRIQWLLEVFEQFQPDCLITECFPFSKHRLKFELLPLLDRAKAARYPVKRVCSVRDLILTQSWSAKERAKRCDTISNWLNQYYDLVLIHGDPQIQTLDDCFPNLDRLTSQVYYTGYVAQSPPEQSSLTASEIAELNHAKPIIVASVGGGRFGYPLLKALAEASTLLEQFIPHQIHAFAGPFMPEDQFLQLQVAIAEQSNITIRRYTANLMAYLNQADLSISLGGYNTTMNILRTGVRSLIFPFASDEQAGEQTGRARKLEEMGVLETLHTDELMGDLLAQRIIVSLHREIKSYAFDLQGAENSSLRLQQLLSNTTVAA